MKTLDKKELFNLIEQELDSSEEYSSDEAVGERVFFDSEKEQAIDDSVKLKMISIRLQNDLIDDLKAIAQLNGLGYQPLIKQVLTRFVVGEKKKIHNDTVVLKAKAKRLQELKIKAEEAEKELRLEQMKLAGEPEFTLPKAV